MNLFSITTDSKKLTGIVFAIVGAGFLVFGGYELWKNMEFVSQSAKTSGVVIENVQRPTKSGYTFAPKYKYEDDKGIQYITESSSSSSPPAFVVGQIVPVLYLKSDHENSRIEDGFWLFGFYSIFVTAGGITLLIGTAMAYLYRNEEIVWKIGGLFGNKKNRL